MYPSDFEASIKKVEAAREENTKLEPRRMTAEEKDTLLATYHPDYKKEEFRELKVGPNKGEKVPTELCALLQGHSRIKDNRPDLSNPDYDVDVLVNKARRQYATVRVENLDLKPAVLLRQPVPYLQYFTEADKNILASKRLRRIYLRAANQIHCVALPL